MKKLIGAGIIAAGVITGLAVAGRRMLHTASNTEHMYDSIDYGLGIITKDFEVKKLDAGRFSDLPVNPLITAHVDRYELEGLGNLAIMSTKMKSMQMSSIVITPWGVNVPMVSFDLMYIMGKRKFLIEFYDLVGDTSSDEYRQVIDDLAAVRDEFDDLPDMPPKKGGDGWLEECRTVIMHKQFPMKSDARGMIMFIHALKAYLGAAKRVGAASEEDRKAQKEKVDAYVDRLVIESGVSTAMFKKAFGEEMTRDFFHEVFFASGE